MEYTLLGVLWLVAVVTIIMFLKGASEPDTKEKRDQDYIDTMEYINNKNNK